MREIRFQNTMKWQGVSAQLFSSEETEKETVEVSAGVLVFDNSKYDHVQFYAAEGGAKASKLYPGKLSLSAEYKMIDTQKEPLIFWHEEEKTGRVDNYIFKDEAHLGFREDKSKKVSVFVPDSYDPALPHGLLYFFDAQNLFANAGQYTDRPDVYGGWQLDVVLKALHEQYGKNILVVGIDNSDEYRSRELLMDLTDYGKLSELAADLSEGVDMTLHMAELSDFMQKTVHPFILEHYAVDEANIGIGGASMGGIAALCCAVRELGFYRYVLSYSPAYGLYEAEAFENYFKTKSFGENKALQPKIHIYCGSGDLLDTQLMQLASRMKEILTRHGYETERIFETYDLDKKHNEESWRAILPDSFTKLFDL